MTIFFAVLSIVAGLALLVWSAGRFVEGAASTARYLAVPPLLIGMVIVGFGTSAPEMVVSVSAAVQGSPGIALGNAYGSNIANITLILGTTALVSPIVVRSAVLRREMPILVGVTAVTAVLLWNGDISRLDALVLLTVFAGLLAWSIWEGRRKRADALATETQQELEADQLPIRQAVFWVVAGLVLLIAGSRLLVWGAVEIARALGVSDLVVGLTVVAAGTSLPELASSISAVRKGEHDIALGNVLGSNLFNTLAGVGLAGLIRPLAAEPEVFTRDVPVMTALTLFLVAIGYGRGGADRTGATTDGGGRITRLKGGILLACYVAYATLVVSTAL